MRSPRTRSNDSGGGDEGQLFGGSGADLVQGIVTERFIFVAEFVDSGDIARIVTRGRKKIAQKWAHGLSSSFLLAGLVDVRRGGEETWEEGAGRECG
jgi:hypothetical protein